MNENLNLKEIFARLSEPFNPNDIEWRAGATNADKTKALALAYITSRAVMDRLDEVIGSENWRDEYAPGPDGGVICGLSLRINGEWITKWDGADNTEFEAIKGGLSDAFKRAGYKWGVGRYLYKLESVWVSCEAHGKTISLKTTPPLPSWALPKDPVKPSANSADTISKDETSSKAAAALEREMQILEELGFGNKKLASAKVTTVTEGHEGNGSNGNNGSMAQEPAGNPQPNPAANVVKRRISWNSKVVEAVLKSNLAANPAEAVRLLNESSLDTTVTPEHAVTQLQSTCNN